MHITTVGGGRTKWKINTTRNQEMRLGNDTSSEPRPMRNGRLAIAIMLKRTAVPMPKDRVISNIIGITLPAGVSPISVRVMRSGDSGERVAVVSHAGKFLEVGEGGMGFMRRQAGVGRRGRYG